MVTAQSVFFFRAVRFFGADFLLGRPPTSGTKDSTSERRTNFLPPTSAVCNRPCCASLRIRSWDTPRTRAASAWVIQSLNSSPNPSFTVELFNVFCYHPLS